MDCLIERIKANLNVNLPYYDKIKCHIGNGGKMYIKSSNNTEITSTSNDSFINGNGESLNFPYKFNGVLTVKPKENEEIQDFFIKHLLSLKLLLFENCQFDSGTKDVSFLQMGNLDSLQLTNTEFDLAWLKNNVNLKTFIVSRGAIGNIDILSSCKFLSLKIQDSNDIYGNISIFNGLTQLNSLQLIGNSEIEGNIESLSNLINLTELYMSGSGNIEGDINKLAQSLFNNGKTSGQLKILGSSTQCVNTNTSTNSLRVVCTFNDSGYSMVTA